MRLPRVATALVALAAGAAALAVGAAAVRRLGARRRPAAVPAARVAEPAPVVVEAPQAVVLPFARRTAAAEQPAAPVRCGDTGGRTKAGAPCGARATVAGRCHHHRLAA